MAAAKARAVEKTSKRNNCSESPSPNHCGTATCSASPTRAEIRSYKHRVRKSLPKNNSDVWAEVILLQEIISEASPSKKAKVKEN